MSNMEYNKGKLIPVTEDEEIIASRSVPDSVLKYHADKVDALRDEPFQYGYEILNGRYYTVEWEVKDGDLYEINNLRVNEDGSLDFETYHYNGGAHWTELVESKLNSLVKGK